MNKDDLKITEARLDILNAKTKQDWELHTIDPMAFKIPLENNMELHIFKGQMRRDWQAAIFEKQNSEFYVERNWLNMGDEFGRLADEAIEETQQDYPELEFQNYDG